MSRQPVRQARSSCRAPVPCKAIRYVRSTESPAIDIEDDVVFVVLVGTLIAHQQKRLAVGFQNRAFFAFLFRLGS